MFNISELDLNKQLNFKLPKKIRIIFASETGQAESISQVIYKRLTTSPLKNIFEKFDPYFIQRYCISDYEKLIDDFWLPLGNNNIQEQSSTTSISSYCSNYNLLIIVASTTGQGDPPNKATKFYRWIRRLRRNKNFSEQFKHLSYALLGLGDTNYDNFANFSKQLNKLFRELGATHYIAPAFADDAVGLELVTEPFIDKLLDTIHKHFNHRIIKEFQSLDLNFMKTFHYHHDHQQQQQQQQQQLFVEDHNSIIINLSQKNQNIDNLVKPLNKMNINQPVVSSCISLSSSDKCNLSDICRQLIEPSSKLVQLSLDQLDLPKYLPSLEDSKHSIIYSQRNLKRLPDYESLNELSISEYLQMKVPNGSMLYTGQVTLSKILSNEDSNECCHKKKTVLECDVEYKFSKENNTHQDDWFVPGDSFGFYSANLLIDVYQVLLSVKVKCSNDDDDDDEFLILWDYFKGNKKQVFIFLNDEKTVVELLPYLVYGVDLRTIPKKSTLCHLAKFTSDVQQRRRLLELSSKQGNNEYQSLIIDQNITICDILRLFNTCHPPINVFLLHIISSKPRYFSASNLPKIIQDVEQQQTVKEKKVHNLKCIFRIVFSVSTNFSHTFMRTSENLLGLFSGKFFHHYDFIPKNFHPDLVCSNLWKTIELIHENVCNGNIFDNQDVPLLLSTSFPVYVFQRLNQKFRLRPVQLYVRPIIMISTGTGVAPFLSYLDALQECKNNHNHNSECSKMSEKMKQIFFIFGCRHPYKDFLNSNQIISYFKDQSLINHLCLCFSRCSKSDLIRFENESQISVCYGNNNNNNECSDENENNIEPTPIKYVNQLIMLHGEELVDLIINHDASIYVCGNWKIISDGIIKAFCGILSRYHFGVIDDDSNEENISPESKKYMKQMKQNGRFLQDIWI